MSAKHFAVGIQEDNPRFQVGTDSGAEHFQIWVFIAEITKKFILGLDILQVYNMLVDVGCHILRLSQEEASL
jgi:hypothetical protein